MLRVVVILLALVAGYLTSLSTGLAAPVAGNDSGTGSPPFSIERLLAGMELAFDTAIPEPAAATFVLSGIALILPGILRKRNRGR
jgi:hypothetical protein